MWATLDDAHRHWPESRDSIADERLTELLAAAYQECAQYVRPATLADPATPGPYPERVVQAQVLAAKDVWGAQTAANSDVIGFDAYGVRRRPLSGQVRALLDPPMRVPLVG